MESDRQHRVTVEASRPGLRLDIFLREAFPAVSRGTFKRLIDQGHVRVNGKMVKATHAPRAGEVVEVEFPPARPTELTPLDLPLKILYEDTDLLVLNKPPGLVVHPASGEEDQTLVHALLHHCKGELSGIGGVERPGIVHRIDKDTSGCLVVAKNDLAHVALSDQFRNREVNKIYHAITCGRVVHDSGDIRAPLGRHPNHRMSRVVDEVDGREAWTTFRVMERMADASLVEVKIHTGRTHQIRVHMHHIGNPLAGDALYGKRQNARLRQETGLEIPRQMLHAHLIEFTHPRGGRLLSFRVPWPEDFEGVLEALRAR
ncbi:MAG TPA: RluA family pseudouridine synthase [Verrucomicrobiales bacterium]|nr:RluA family pseudouridine synthase [Verrucomicrobiales bacterium]